MHLTCCLTRTILHTIFMQNGFKIYKRNLLSCLKPVVHVDSQQLSYVTSARISTQTMQLVALKLANVDRYQQLGSTRGSPRSGQPTVPTALIDYVIYGRGLQQDHLMLQQCRWVYSLRSERT